MLWQSGEAGFMAARGIEQRAKGSGAGGIADSLEASSQSILDANAQDMAEARRNVLIAALLVKFGAP